MTALKTKTITVKVDEDTLNQFKQICNAEGMTYSDTIRLLMREVVIRGSLNLRILLSNDC